MQTEVLKMEIAKLEIGPTDMLVMAVEPGFDLETRVGLSKHIHRILGHNRFIVVQRGQIDFSLAKFNEADGHVQD